MCCVYDLVAQKIPWQPASLLVSPFDLPVTVNQAMQASSDMECRCNVISDIPGATSTDTMFNIEC